MHSYLGPEIWPALAKILATAARELRTAQTCLRSPGGIERFTGVRVLLKIMKVAWAGQISHGLPQHRTMNEIGNFASPDSSHFLANVFKQLGDRNQLIHPSSFLSIQVWINSPSALSFTFHYLSVSPKTLASRSTEALPFSVAPFLINAKLLCASLARLPAISTARIATCLPISA